MEKRANNIFISFPGTLLLTGSVVLLTAEYKSGGRSPSQSSTRTDLSTYSVIPMMNTA